MREVGALSTLHTHPVALGRNPLAALLAHFQSRLGNLLASCLCVTGVGVDVAVGTRAIEAGSCVEVRAGTEDGGRAHERERERLDLSACERLSARLMMVRERDERRSLTFLLDSFSTLIST